MKTCRKCGALFETRACRECAKVRHAKYRADHPEKVKAGIERCRNAKPEQYKKSSAKWGVEHPEEAKAARDRWHADHPESGRASVSKWQKANLEYLRIRNQNREATKRKNGGALSPDLAAKLFKMQKGKCPCCGRPLGKDAQLDHRMPVVLGGPNEDWNMQLLRKKCNQQKHAKHPIDFMQSRGFLL